MGILETLRDLVGLGTSHIDDDLLAGRAEPFTPETPIPDGFDDEALHTEKATALLEAVDASAVPNAAVTVTPIFDPLRPGRYAVTHDDGSRYDVIVCTPDDKLKNDPDWPGYPIDFLREGIERELG